MLSGNILNAQTNSVELSDSLALVELFNQTGGETWTNSLNWLNTPVEMWFGITVENNRVTEIKLNSNNLSGKLPQELKDLSELKTLQLHSNNLSDTLPTWLSQLAKLEYLHLAYNDFTGSIPPQLAQLPNIQYLYLYANKLTGNIPPQLGQLNSLINLYLHDNKLTGSIPPQLGNLQNLVRLYLYNNQLTGNLPPELGNLSKLYILYAYNNQLSGNIPPEFKQLTNLTYLYLNNNILSGQLPPQLAELPKLYYLQLNNNNFSGSIPPQWGEMSNIRNLYLHMNQLKGNIPPQLGQLSQLVNLNLSLNQLSGNIPTELGLLHNLLTLDLSINQLSGNIPTELGLLTNLTSLNINLNNLTGNIPASFNNLTALETLNLASNMLSSFDADSLFLLPENSNISIYYNNLTFEDLENKSQLFNRYFYYSPQHKIGQSLVISADTGANYTLDIQCGGTQNNYQWFFNGSALAPPSNNPQYNLVNIGPQNIGDYTCKITSPLVPELIIESNPITIQFKPLGQHAPYNILLSNNQIAEQSTIGTLVGKFTALDTDFDDKHFFMLTPGEGDTDNHRFFIAENSIFNAEVFDFEKNQSFSIRITATDRAGNSFVKVFNIRVSDVVEHAPEDIFISNSSIYDNLPTGQLVGYLSALCNNDTLSTEIEFSLENSDNQNNNSDFFIAANQLRSNRTFDFETDNALNIFVKATHKNGLSFSKAFTIEILHNPNDVLGSEHGQLFIPDAFSPNNDQINDLFVIQGLYALAPATINIYSLDGLCVYSAVFQTNSANQTFDWWNGSLNNLQQKILPQQAYCIIVSDKNAQHHKKIIYLKR
jgi:Leucine-rich repeat (LRR) protein